MYERNGVVGILIVVLLVMLQIQFSSSLEFSTNDGILNYGAINKITGERISGQKILHYSKNWVKYNKQGFPTEMYYNYSKKIELSEITEINEPKYEPKKRSFKIKTKNGEVVPKPLKDKKLKDHFKSLNLKNNKVYVRIQFEGEDGNPSPEEVEILERDGIKLLDWHGDHIYYARVPKTILETKSYDFIRWIGINEDIKIKKKSRDYISSNDVDLILIFYEDITNEDIEDIKNIQGIKIIEKGLDRLIVEVNSGNVDELLSINSIKKAEIYLKPQLTLDNSVNIISADFVWNQPNIASGITIGVIDSGIEHNHSHFSSTNIYDAKDYTDNDNYPEIGTLDHGVHVAGIISGSGNYNGRTITGASYGANLVIQRVFNATGYFAPDANESDIWENILDPDNDNDYDEATSADIISNSWSIEWPDSLQVDGDYSTTSEQVDITVNGGNSNGKKVPVIFAAGNDYGRGSGYLKVDFPGTSKNAITVGATGDYFSSDTYDNHGGFYDSDNLYVMDYSERGTDDGRVKPDILAPGSDITSSVLGDTYVSKSGTSMAAPHVSAVAAQILYAYPTLSPAGVKAFIISGAVGGGTTDNININQGWGRLNADRAVYKLADEYIDSYDENTVDENIFTTNIPSTRCYNIVVPSNANKFITTLVWDDIPGDKSNDGTNTLYNDIDLWLKYPNGTILSWTEDDDSINNVEKYVLNDPISGDWNVCVSQIDLDGYLFGSQDYAISIVVLKETSTPTLNVDLYLENGAVEPGASTTVYANIDVEGLLGYDLFADLDVSGGLTITSGEFDGSDSDKDRIGDISVGRNRNTRTWTIRGDTEGARTISINITGKRIDGSTYSASDSITLNVQSGGDPGGNSSTIDCEGNYSGYEQCIRYEAGNCDVEIATNYYDNVNNIRWGLVNGSSNPYVINNYTVGWRGLDAEKEYYDVNNPSADCVSGGCTSGELIASFGTKHTVIA
ncbi:MAG: S8 family serine peptidase, partial [Nanoarchaeota archaeon]|nr:S8 family serine peptidase [Nanoarchaeota archaeon]